MDSMPETVMKSEEQMTEQIPSVVKSHLPLHLQSRAKHPLKSSTDVNKGNTHVSTPAIIKRRQLNKWFNSPTDSCLSPCTQKLLKPKHDNHIEPLNLDENDGLKQMPSNTDH